MTQGEQIAQHVGFIARLHDHLGLNGTNEEERFDAVRTWLSDEVAGDGPVPADQIPVEEDEE